MPKLPRPRAQSGATTAAGLGPRGGDGRVIDPPLEEAHTKGWLAALEIGSAAWMGPPPTDSDGSKQGFRASTVLSLIAPARSLRRARVPMMPALSFGTPRKLPKGSQLHGRVAVLDIAFAGAGQSGGFEAITVPFINALGDRLRVWVDHHDHEQHGRFAQDPRFVLSTKAAHGACPEMIQPALVERVGPVDTIVCHTDFDGLASAAKWILGGVQPYEECDRDALAIDTRLGRPTRVGERIDRAIRARPRDAGLHGLIVRHLVNQLRDESLWSPINQAAEELVPIERETHRAAAHYRRFESGVAIVDVTTGFSTIDKTLLLLLGQDRERVSVVIDRENVSVAARFDSGLNFLELFRLPGGMPTRVSLPRSRLREVLNTLRVDAAESESFVQR